MINGVLPFRYCTTKFPARVPTWVLPSSGPVADLITEGGEDVGLVHVASYAGVRSASGGAGGPLGCRTWR